MNLFIPLTNSSSLTFAYGAGELLIKYPGPLLNITMGLISLIAIKLIITKNRLNEVLQEKDEAIQIADEAIQIANEAIQRAEAVILDNDRLSFLNIHLRGQNDQIHEQNIQLQNFIGFQTTNLPLRRDVTSLSRRVMLRHP